MLMFNTPRYRANDIQRTYGFDNDKMEKFLGHLDKLPQENLKVIDLTPQITVVALEANDMVGNEERQPFLVFDDMIDYSFLPIIETDKYRVVEQGLPIAIVDLTNQRAEDWVRTIKTQPTYTVGSKYMQLSVSTLLLDVESALQKCAPDFEKKREKYPDSRPEITFPALCDLTGCIQCGIIDIRDTKEHKDIARFLIAYNRDTMYGYFVSITDDPMMLAKHRCYIVAHAEVVRMADHFRLNYANFGMYFGFKDVLTFEKRWVKGLRYKE